MQNVARIAFLTLGGVALTGLLVATHVFQKRSGTSPETTPVSFESTAPEPHESAPSGPPAMQDFGEPIQLLEGERGRVSVRLSRPSFDLKQDRISAKIVNGFEVPVYTGDMKTDCSIALLEYRRPSSWEVISGCAQRRPPATVPIDPGRARTVTIDPRSEHLRFGRPDTGPALEPGVYRLHFTYVFATDPGDQRSHSVYSREFLLR